MDKRTELRFELCWKKMQLMESKIESLEDELRKLKHYLALPGHDVIPFSMVFPND